MDAKGGKVRATRPMTGSLARHFRATDDGRSGDSFIAEFTYRLLVTFTRKGSLTPDRGAAAVGPPGADRRRSGWVWMLQYGMEYLGRVAASDMDATEKRDVGRRRRGNLRTGNSRGDTAAGNGRAPAGFV